MLKTLSGDLFTYALADSIIAHGCNLQGVMNSGFAKQLRRKYPRAYLEYREAFREGGLELGDYLLVHCKGMDIFHCMTQRYYGRDKEVVYVDYDAVRKSLAQCAAYATRYNKTVYLPFIGGGLANGDQGRLMDIFTEVFKDTDAILCFNSEGNAK